MAKDRKEVLREQKQLYDQMMCAVFQVQRQQHELTFSTCASLCRSFERDYPYAMGYYERALDQARSNYSDFIKENNLPWTPQKIK